MVFTLNFSVLRSHEIRNVKFCWEVTFGWLTMTFLVGTSYLLQRTGFSHAPSSYLLGIESKTAVTFKHELNFSGPLFVSDCYFTIKRRKVCKKALKTYNFIGMTEFSSKIGWHLAFLADRNFCLQHQYAVESCDCESRFCKGRYGLRGSKISVHSISTGLPRSKTLFPFQTPAWADCCKQTGFLTIARHEYWILHKLKSFLYLHRNR